MCLSVFHCGDKIRMKSASKEWVKSVLADGFGPWLAGASLLELWQSRTSGQSEAIPFLVARKKGSGGRAASQYGLDCQAPGR